MNHSPARILQEHLITEGVFDDPDVSDPSWPVYVGLTPDNEGVPDTVGTLYDTEGFKNGRLMEGSEVLHLGLELRVRAESHDQGWSKLQEALIALQSVRRTEVNIDSTTYRVDNVSLVGTPSFIGVEHAANRRRRLFTANFLTTISQED